MEPLHVLRPLRPQDGERRVWCSGNACLWNEATGEATWDSVQLASAKELRISVQPDEGSPMFCVVQYLQKKGFRIHFVRDELQLDGI